MPVTKVKSRWDSGNLIFHESDSLATIADILTIGTEGVTVGSTTNDINFSWVGLTSGTFDLDATLHTLVTTGLDWTITGDIALTGNLTVDIGDVQIGDDDYLMFGDGTGGDVSARWVSGTSILEWLPLTDATGAFVIGNGTKNIDFKVFGASGTGYYLLYDESEDDLILAGVLSELELESTVNSVSTATGSIHTLGGLGVALNSFFGGLVTADGDTGFRYNGTLVPDANRTDYALGIGLHATELTVNLANAVTQNVEPIQININLTASGGAPSSSTVNSIYQLITHDTVDMPALRIKCADWNIVADNNFKDAYVIQTELDIVGNVTIAGEAFAGSFYLNAGTGTYTVNDRLAALFAITSGTATVTGTYNVAHFFASANSTVDNILQLETISTASITAGMEMLLDGTVTYAMDFQGTVSDGWTSGDLTGSDEYGAFDEYSLIPVRVAGVTATLYIMAAETWKAVTV